MESNISFKGIVKQFSGPSGWHFIVVPKKYTRELQEQRNAWGMYSIKAHVGNTFWKTRLMMKKGGDFFVALKLDIRTKENISVGNKISISFTLE
jgi:hypothetical protein